MTPAEIEQGRRLVEQLQTRSCTVHSGAHHAMRDGGDMLSVGLDAYEAAVAENARLREGLENAFRDFGHIEQEAQGVRVKIVRLAHAGRDRARALLSGGGA